MTFSRKIFISVFAVTLLLGSLILWAAHTYVKKQTEEKFVSRYSVFTKILADTLSQLDVNTEALMLNAAKVFVERDAKSGLLSDAETRHLRDELKITHLFVTDHNGKFIRSTNEDAAVTPNLFSFCPDYKKLIVGKSNVEATPIIKPQPEPKPFKFLSVPSRDHKRILEVGVRVDFIAKTLTEAIKSDTNLISMSLFGPDGTSFGKFDSKEISFSDEKVSLPENLNSIESTDLNYRFYSKVQSSHPRCCQCDVAGTSRNGEYYYVLVAGVSKKELVAIQATTAKSFFLLGIANLILSLLLSRFLSRRLVRKIERAAEKIKKMKDHANPHARLDFKGQDEVAFLTQEFDRLLEVIEQSQDTLVEAEKAQAKIQMAKEIAHNIKSPIVAIEMMLPMMSKMPERLQNVMRKSVQEIKGLTQKLAKAETLASVDTISNQKEVLFLPIFLKNIVAQKEIEFSTRSVQISLSVDGELKNAFVFANSIEFATTLSNIINNAAESYAPSGGQIMVRLEITLENCNIEIIDRGVGIPGEFLDSLGTKQITFKGDSERGVGLLHARKVIQSMGGKLKLKSELGAGTNIILSIPHFRSGSKTPSRVLEADA